MIVTTNKLQRTISYTGIEKVKTIAVDAAGYLKRLNRSPRDAESVLNLVGSLKAELDKVPSSEQGEIAVEVNTDVSRAWLTVLVEYTRAVTLLEKKVAAQPELGGIRSANTAEEAADRLAAQMQDQLELPVQTLDSIIAEQEQREKEQKKADEEFANGTSPAPHRGVKAKPDDGLAKNGPAADPRNRRGPAGAAGKKPKDSKKWDRTHRPAKSKDKKGKPTPVEPEVQERRDGPTDVNDV